MTRKKLPPIFDKSEFLDFCSALEVETKELGVVRLGDQLLGSQRYFVEEIARGLSEGIHYFVVLKGRQLGISTVCLALDLYWHFKHEGMQGTLATDTEENREMFRSTLELYIEGLPQRWKQPVRISNRTQLVMGNRSRLVYQVAGTRGQNKGFGAGKAITFVHATEVGRWGDGIDISSFEASLAETNPNRLYIWESTAYGFNQFNDMWETAQDAHTQRAIFIGWWRNELYMLKRGSEPYKVYWDGSQTSEEKKWCDEVRDLYDFEITDEQLAWHRFTLAEKMKGDEQQMHEKYPPTAEYAFILTGSQFFSVQRITDQYKVVRKKGFEVRRFVFGQAFEDTELVEATERSATLKVWQMPVRGAQYAIGADPAWGSSEWADRFVVNVSRCYADGIEQVAEFCTAEMNVYQFAWVLLYLAGAYGDPSLNSNIMINLELNGPGMAVWSEVQGLKQRAAMAKEQSSLSRILQNIQNFLYRRPDGMGGGGWNYHTKTTAQEKERMMNMLKDNHEFGSLIINSTDCLEEMKNVIRVEGGLTIEAPGRKKDDRVVAQALAVLAWSDLLRVRLGMMGLTRAKSAERDANPNAAPEGRSISNYLKQLGVKVPAQQ